MDCRLNRSEPDVLLGASELQMRKAKVLSPNTYVHEYELEQPAEPTNTRAAAAEKVEQIPMQSLINYLVGRIAASNSARCRRASRNE